MSVILPAGQLLCCQKGSGASGMQHSIRAARARLLNDPKSWTYGLNATIELSMTPFSSMKIDIERALPYELISK